MWKYQRTIIGYHGCDAAVAEKVLNGAGQLVTSENEYDWLGKGIYFWEHGPARALEWAEEIHRRRPDRISNPAVIGAVLQLGFCFDLADVEHTRYLREIYPLFCDYLQAEGQMVPENKGVAGESRDLVLRFRDCAVLNWAIPFLEHAKGARVQTVRCLFVEGDAAFEGSAIREKSHVQIEVRDPACILGYFRPAD